MSPAWLSGGHLQTIYSNLFITAPRAGYRRERIELEDGDFLDFDWIDGNANAPVVVLFHGLEGSSASYYAQSLMHSVKARGWNGTVAHFRGCWAKITVCRAPISPETGAEIKRILHHVKSRHPDAPLCQLASRSVPTPC